jgi:hypothetical protein
MPYIHKKCGGEINWIPFLPLPPKCTNCGKRWNPLIQFGPPRKDMFFMPPEVKVPSGSTTYASWGDKIPGVPIIASRLPNWPRWARVLTFIILLMGVSYLIHGFIWGF